MSNITSTIVPDNTLLSVVSGGESLNSLTTNVGATTLSQLTDVDLQSVADGSVLIYDTNEFVAQTLTGAISLNSDGTVIINPNAITLGSDTSGSYVSSITGTADQIIVNGSGEETAAVTLSLPQSISNVSSPTFANITITGNINNFALDEALDSKSNVGHGHTLSEVSGLQSALDGKQPVGNYATGGGTATGTNTGDQDLSGLVPKTTTVNGIALESNITLSSNDIGLGNVDNTSDINKPISTSTQTALDLKADDADLTSHIEDTDNPHDVTATQVGLGAVDNTSDLDKPISTLTQQALDGKQPVGNYATGGGTATGTNTGDQDLSGLVPKTTTVNGKALSTNITLSKADVGLGNVDNTSDINKPISTSTQTALDLKADDVDLNAHVNNTNNPHAVNATQVGLGNVDNTSDINKPISTSTQTALDLKANIANPIFTGSVTLPRDPTAALEAATKEYVDSVASGIVAKPSVLFATSSNLDAAYLNGTLGVGATLKSAVNGALTAPDVDGVIGFGTGVLVKNQTTRAHNGRYFVSDVGSPSTPWILTRCGFCDEADEIPGAYIFVQDGTFAGSGYVLIVDDPTTFEVGSDNINVFQFSGAGTYTASNGVVLVDNQFQADGTIARIADPVFTGTPGAPTAAPNTDNTQIATTAFAKKEADDAQAYAVQRANHTGTQDVSTITGLGTLATQDGTFSGTSSGTNTGDQDLSGLVPYTGATGDVNLGSRSLAASKASLSDGTEALPSYTFTSDGNSGMWSPAADTLAWSTGGSERVRITSSGNVTMSGNLTVDTDTFFVDSVNNRVGIGTASPASKLDIYNSATAYAQFNETGGLYIRDEDTVNGTGKALLTLDGPYGSTVFYGSFFNTSNINLNSSQSLYVGRGGGGLSVGTYSGAIVNKFHVAGNSSIGSGYWNTAAPTNGLLVEGNVGIGTTTPSEKLTVSGNISASGSLSAASANITGDLTVDTNTLYVDSADSRVGIGTTNPSVKLDIGGHLTSSPVGVPSVYISDDVNNVAGVLMGNVNIGDTADFRFLIKDTTDHYLAFAQPSVGNTQSTIFGLARSSSDFIFNNGGTPRNLAIGTNNGTHLIFGTSGAERMRIASDGDVGVGTTNPLAKLHVEDSTLATVRIGAGTRRINLNSYAGDWNYQTSNGAPYVFGTADNNQLLFYQNNQERMRIQTGGNVGIGTTNPTSTLHVVGNSLLGGSVTTTSNLLVGGPVIYLNNQQTLTVGVDNLTLGNAAAWSTITYGHASATKHYFVAGNVGIGTDTPSAKLHVAGDTQVDGHFSATTKSFLIDNPNGGKLQYGVVESNEHGVYVRGKTSDSTITLPEHWEWLVDADSVTVQLTPVGKYQSLYVISQTHLSVEVGGVEGEYNYTIYGTRKDVEPLTVDI